MSEELDRYKRALETLHRRRHGFPVSAVDVAEAEKILQAASTVPRKEAEDLLREMFVHWRTKKIPGVPAPGQATEDYIRRHLDERDAKKARQN